MGKTKNKLNKNRLLFLFSIFVFLISFIVLIICFSLYYEKYIMSDMSSELILGKQLAQEGRFIFSKNWYYSTEIRVINNQIIYGIMFRITSDFRIVFCVSQVIIIIIYLLCLYILLKSINTQKYFFLLATICLVPFYQTCYFSMILVYQFYIPHICFSFLIIACFHYYQKKSNKLTITLCIAAFLSFFNSLEGPRAIAVLTIPLFIIIALRYIRNKNQKFLIFGLFIVSFSCIGFCINQFYLKKSFNLYSGFFNISFNFQKLKNAIWLSLESIGCNKTFSNYGWLSNIVFVLTVIYVISYVYLLIRNYKKIDRNIFSLFMFFCLSFFMVFLMFCFAYLELTTRYFLPSTPFLIILLPNYFYLLSTTIFKTAPKKQFYFNTSGVFTCFLILSSIFIINYKKEFSSNFNSYKEIACELINRNLLKGYSTFWMANSVSQFSNGKIDMYSYSDYKKGEGLHIYRWLQLKSHEDFLIKGNTFIIFAPKEIDSELYNDGLKYSYETKDFNSGYKIQFFSDITPLFNNNK